MQALAQVARTHADRFKLLDAVQDHLDLVELDTQLRVQRGLDILEGLFQVAIGIDAVDQGDGDLVIGFRQGQQVDLPFQVALQGFAAAGARGEIPVVIVVAGQGAGRSLVDVLPVRVHRQFAGDLLVPVAFLLAMAVVEGFQGDGLGQGSGGDVLITVAIAGGLAGTCSEIIIAVVGHLQHGIGFQRLLHLLLEIQTGQLK